MSVKKRLNWFWKCPRRTLAFSVAWVLTINCIEFGYVGYYMGKWEEAFLTMMLIYAYFLILITRRYYKLLTQLAEDSRRPVTPNPLARVATVEEASEGSRPSQILTPMAFRAVMKRDTEVIPFQPIEETGLETPRQKPVNRSAADVIRLNHFVMEQVSGSEVWDIPGYRELHHELLLADEFHLQIGDPAVLLAMTLDDDGCSWRYAIYIDYRRVASGKSKAGNRNALLQLATMNPGLVITERIAHVMRAMQEIVDEG